MTKRRVKLGRPKGRKYEKLSVSLPKGIVESLNEMEKKGIIKNKSQFIAELLDSYLYLKDPELVEGIDKMRETVRPIYILLDRLVDVARNKKENTDLQDVFKVFMEVARLRESGKLK
ncbi:MAG: hypothetical protein QW412_01585 [Candidatus Aenigmatarchaeota archaeon]